MKSLKQSVAAEQPFTGLMLRFCSRQLVMARSAKSKLRMVFLNPMLISSLKVIGMSTI